MMRRLLSGLLALALAASLTACGQPPLPVSAVHTDMYTLSISGRSSRSTFTAT